MTLRAFALAFVVAVGSAELAASEHRGQVRFGQVPVHGATVQAAQGDKTIRAMTDPEGRYVLPDLSDGMWMIQVEMPGFETLRREVTVVPDATPAQWDLQMLRLAEIQAEPAAAFPAPLASSAQSLILEDSSAQGDAGDRLLINGSVVNGAATPFGLQRAFGNVRIPRSPYRGAVSLRGNTSLFDARAYSLTGQDTRQPAYGRAQGTFTIGGPLQIPGRFRMGTFQATYSRTQNRDTSLQTARMPTDAERAGDFSASAALPIDPATGLPFPGGVVPLDRISPQARALLALYPQPNFNSAGPFNYQAPIAGTTQGDNFQGNITNIRIGRADQLSGTGSYQTTHSDRPDLFGFTDASRSSTMSAAVLWIHRFTPRISGTLRYEFNRTLAETVPHFSNLRDVSGDAGISGNDRDPRNWGPPALTFSGGLARLGSGSYARDRSRANGVSYSSTWIVGRHALGYGADYRRQRFDLFSQRDGRGTFTFTGAATGSDMADFLLGLPAASSLAFGNPDKFFRQSFANLYVTDDFKLTPSLTVNAGVRWEYESPITERFGRLVNLEIAPGFASAVPVVAGTPGEPPRNAAKAFRQTLMRPDMRGVQPRIGLAWRPRLASSVVIRAGYGVHRDTSVYRAIADQMSQQAPLSKSLSVENTPANPLTLADGFRGSPSVTATTFAIDPRFRVGTAQHWQLGVQRDLPGSMQATVTYLAIKGTHVPQRLLPNTFPAGAANPCPECPAGFIYLTSNGNSNRHSGTIEVRRRQRNGLEASARYTLAKAVDDAGLGGHHIVQNWLDPGAERGPSNFDQRHELVVQGQYTSGMLAGIGTFWDGWAGKLLQAWTLTGQMTSGSGLPLTPVILAPVSGTGMTGSLRPNVTGAPIDARVDGRFVNPAAFVAPGAGRWGNAGRNSIRGPAQFQFNASLARSFRFSDRVGIDLRIDATNVLNRVTFPDWNTMVGSSHFGLPTRANGMRTLQPSLRLRF